MAGIAGALTKAICGVSSDGGYITPRTATLVATIVDRQAIAVKGASNVDNIDVARAIITAGGRAELIIADDCAG
jgi:hypothetical protein